MEPALEVNHTLDRFRLLFEATVDYAVFHLGFDGLIETWNPGAERIFGFTPPEIVGKHGSICGRRRTISREFRSGKPATLRIPGGPRIHDGTLGRTARDSGPMASCSASGTDGAML